MINEADTLCLPKNVEVESLHVASADDRGNATEEDPPYAQRRRRNKVTTLGSRRGDPARGVAGKLEPRRKLRQTESRCQD